MVLLGALVGIVRSHAADGAPYVRGQLIPELRLHNGTVMHDVIVTAVGTSTVLAKWEGGRGSILLSQLPDGLRADLTRIAEKPVPPTSPLPPASPPPGTGATSAAPESLELPTEIKLTNGFVMHQSVVVRWQKDAVLVRYLGGTVLVRIGNIATEQRAIFETRKDEELGRQAKHDARLAGSDDSAAQAEQARQAEAAQAGEHAEQKAEEIRNGISSHYLVKGMTKEQVILAFGRPPDDHGNTFFYASRGHDKYGNSADRMLVFRDGILVSWRDQREQETGGAVEY